ncbi:Mut7-C RNAse domain-containing protein [Haloarchaeobius sp. HRN-SO-5]|uniref:Mut7-C RNAse domain-containing protein n=1 Tax=Haloarchaeobius sp. HRN-SO-5 TaxID=3446118 RepID=UPI003EBC1390
MVRFLLDVMLGNLAVYLRLCGYDTVYALDRDAEADDRLLALAAEEGRTVVTRDEHLAARADDAILLRTRGTEPQLRELVEAGVELDPTDDPVQCGRCNGRLDRVDGGSTTPEYAPDDDTPVWRCRECGQYFWKGSHWDRMVATLAEVRDA